MVAKDRITQTLTDANGRIGISTAIWYYVSSNASDRARFMGGVTYSKRFIAQRFYPFIDYRMPEHVLENASPRLQRMLGSHKKGAYG